MDQGKDLSMEDITMHLQKPDGDGAHIEGYGGVYTYGWDGEPVVSPIDTII
jgi:hypothetical protein